MASEPVSFELTVDGDITGRHYVGKFTSRPTLSWASQLRQSKLRRELLGADYLERIHEDGGVSANANTRERNQAEIVSYLAVRLVVDQCPDWFTKELQMGSACEDDNLMQVLYDKAREVELSNRADYKKAAAANAEKLKAQAVEMAK